MYFKNKMNTDQPVCPIARIPVTDNDRFEFVTKSGKTLIYSAAAMNAYINHRGKMQDPMTREPMNHRHLLQLQRVCGKRKTKLTTEFLKIWRNILNVGLRAEFSRQFENFADTGNHDALSLSISYLLTLKGVVGPATYRALLNERMRTHETVTKSVKAVSDNLDEKFEVEYDMCEHSFSVRFRSRTDVDCQPVLPLYEIKTESSVTEALLEARRNSS